MGDLYSEQALISQFSFIEYSVKFRRRHSSYESICVETDSSFWANMSVIAVATAAITAAGSGTTGIAAGNIYPGTHSNRLHKLKILKTGRK